MKRRSQIRQSIAVSAVLMVLLFALPLAVIVPFREELFGGERAADETSRSSTRGARSRSASPCRLR